MDKITLARIQTAHPKLRAELGRIYEDICVALSGRATCRFAYVVRTFDEQAALFAQGRTKPGPKVTNAGPGASYHNYGLAVDIVLIIDGKVASWDTLKDFDGDKVADWMECVRIFKAHGWAWGGDFKSLVDKPHFEKTLGKTVRELLTMKNAGKVDAAGYVTL